MKIKMRISVLLLMLVVVLVSCQKEELAHESEVPQWLKEWIDTAENSIESNPDKLPNFTAWIRFEYADKYYYEYACPLCSTYSFPRDENGDEINPYEDPYLEYWEKRCCQKYVWKAPDYIEF